MKTLDDKVRTLLESSAQVINDCILENGAVVAANTDEPFFSVGVDNYRYVWVRDASFILYAAQLLGLDARSEFSAWLLERAEYFKQKGLINRRYATHGMAGYRFGKEFQPDQTGALLWVLTEKPVPKSESVKSAVEYAADRLCEHWKGDYFSIQTYDLWEMFTTHPQKQDSFTYSLAMCSFGLRRAHDVYGNRSWLRVSEEMEKTIENGLDGDFYGRRIGKNTKNVVDGSLLGLVWPCGFVDKTSINTVTQIKDVLLNDDGIVRFRKDVYDGRVKNMKLVKKGAGSWPLLTSWYSIVMHELGNEEAAREVFEGLTRTVPDKYIPEQILDGTSLSVSPLGWSHAMYVIAAYKLGYALPSVKA